MPAEAGFRVRAQPRRCSVPDGADRFGGVGRRSCRRLVWAAPTGKWTPRAAARQQARLPVGCAVAAARNAWARRATAELVNGAYLVLPRPVWQAWAGLMPLALYVLRRRGLCLACVCRLAAEYAATAQVQHQGSRAPAATPQRPWPGIRRLLRRGPRRVLARARHHPQRHKPAAQSRGAFCLSPTGFFCDPSHRHRPARGRHPGPGAALSASSTAKPWSSNTAVTP